MLTALPALAQDSEPDNPIEVVIGDDINPVPSETLYTFFESLLVTYLAGAIPLVLVLTQATKLAFPDIGINPIRLVWTVVFWGVFIVLNYTGYTAQFENLVPAVATILATVLGISVTPASAGVAFDLAHTGGVPILGKARSIDTKVSDTQEWLG